MASMDDAIHDAQDAAEGGVLNSIIGGLASRIGGFASASAVYGDPVDQDGVTVIPVARIRWGFGGGGGSDGGGADGAAVDSGAGAGGGVTAHPVGFIELRDGEAEFRPINDPAAPALVVLAAGFTAWLVLRGLKSLFR